MKRSRLYSIAFLTPLIVLSGAATYYPFAQDSEDLRNSFEDIGARLLRKPIAPAPFTLADQHGRDFTQNELSGSWTVAFFGYTHCADVCPTTLSALSRVEEHFSELPAADRPRFVFVSVDPKRDSLPVLREHVTFFSKNMIGATGHTDELRSLTQSLGVEYAYLDRDSRRRVNLDSATANDEYIVEHSSDLFVFAPDGTNVGLIFPPFQPERVARALAQFMRTTPSVTSSRS